MLEITFDLQSKEYWNFRKGKIGASDAPIIMGDSPWKTPYQLWKEKLSDEKTPLHSWMERGIILEPEARELTSKKLNLSIESGIVVLHPAYDNMMMASLDGYNREEDIIFEIKCPGKEDHSIAKDGKVPKKYIAQLQHQLACIPRARYSYYVSYDGSDCILVKVERDKEYIEKLIKKEIAFFDCLQNLIPPQMDVVDKKARSDDEWLALSNDCLLLMNKIEAFKDELEYKKEQLIQMSKGLSAYGGGISLDLVEQKGTIDYKSIPELRNIDLDKYRSDSKSFWKLSKKKG